MDVAEISAQISASDLNHVVITGGEPMLFEPIVDLARSISEQGRRITFETAGTVFRRVDCDLMSISPKLANSTPSLDSGWQARHEKTRHDRGPLADLLNEYDCQLKFVVNPEAGDDLTEIDCLLATLPKIDSSRILLMAEGTDSETLNRRMRLLAPICMERNWRLTPRMHVDLFGNTRGT
jgi:7-carboxy-7-deazaguanine synthase